MLKNARNTFDVKTIDNSTRAMEKTFSKYPSLKCSNTSINKAEY